MNMNLCMKLNNAVREATNGLQSKALKLSFLAIGLVALSAGAFAQTDLSYSQMALGNNNADYVNFDFNGKSIEPNGESVYAGAIQFNDLSTTPNSSIDLYCADLTSNLDSSSHGYTVTKTSTSPNTGYNLAGSLVADFYVSATTADEQAGLQLAIWQAIYGSSTITNLSVGRGDQNTITTDAATDTTYAMAHSGVADYYATSATGGQSQLGSAPQSQAAPEPWTIGLALAGGLLALAKIRRSA